MRRLCLGVLLLLYLAPELQAAPYFKYLYVAKRDGNVKIWRTHNGVRTSPTPAADSDVVAGDSVWVHGEIPWCNDVDIKWSDATAQPKSNFVGYAYSYNQFEEFLGSHPGPMPHLQLADVTGLEIDCDLDLEFWWSHLQSNPPPDPLATYNFVNGACAELPGYLVNETVSGLALTGECEVIGEAQLSLQDEAVPSLGRFGLLGLASLLLLLSTITLWRRFSGFKSRRALEAPTRRVL